MNIKRLSLTPLIVALSACSGHRAAAKGEPAAPSPAAPLAAVSPLSALSATLAEMSLSLSEPLGCARYAHLVGEDRPDQDAKSLSCIVDWMGEARTYLANGGKPTKYTNEEEFKQYREEAQELSARIAKWTAASRFEALSTKIGVPDPVPAEPAIAKTGASVGADSEQHYLSGVVLFQKGDYLGARREWQLAKESDPANKDAQEGLDRLNKLLQ
jgi:hypothetical protein